MARDDNDHDENTNSEIKINGNGADSDDNGLPEENMSDKINTLEQKLEEKNNSYNDLYERYLRIAADFDNYKKRMTKEKNDLVAYGNEELIKALLNVIDNLERALQHKSNDIGSKSLIEGIDLVYRQFLSTLEKFGLERINAEKGAKFDPNYHQAVEHIETDDITPGMVVNEMIKGYLLKERLLRPSMVAVSKGLKKTLATENLSNKKDKHKTKDNDKADNDLKTDDKNIFQIDDSDDNIDKNSFSIEINTDNEDNSSGNDSSTTDDEILDLVDEDEFEEKQ